MHHTAMDDVSNLVVRPTRLTASCACRPHHTDDKAGIAFILSAPRGEAQSEVCIDDVALAGSAP